MKKRNYFTSILLAVLILLQMFTPLKTIYGSVLLEIDIPAEAEAYAYNHYEEVIETVKAYSDNYGITTAQLKDITLGTPFIIYELDESVQDEIYYYPLLDSEGNVILLMSIIGTTEGWSASASTEWVNGLEEIGDITSEFIFYKSGDNLFAENRKEEYNIAGEADADITAFSNKTYQSKRRAISNAQNRFVKTDVNNIEITDDNIRDSYTPSFSTSTSSQKICSLYKKRGQGNYGLCWAATVATICNYRNGTSLTAKNVADDMGIGYNDGASPSQARTALKNNGLSYKVNLNSTNRMSWLTLMENINNKYPVYVSAKSSKNGHAVTAYGYAIAAGTKYVILWNSGTKTSVTAQFKESGTTFTYNNLTYTWTYSVSEYN